MVVHNFTGDRTGLVHLRPGQKMFVQVVESKKGKGGSSIRSEERLIKRLIINCAILAYILQYFNTRYTQIKDFSEFSNQNQLSQSGEPLQINTFQRLGLTMPP